LKGKGGIASWLSSITPSLASQPSCARSLRFPAPLTGLPHFHVLAFGACASPMSVVRPVRRPLAPHPAARRTSLSIHGQSFAPTF